MPKQLNVNLAFTADTGKAAASIKSLQQQLTQLMNTANVNSQTLGLTKEIKEATTAVAQLKSQLSSATNSTGNLDLTKFNDSLKASGMTLESYRAKLSALGSDGTAAFSQLASSIASAEIPIRRANGLLQEMGTTLANTVRWQLSSSLLHGFIGGIQSAFGYAQDLNESLNRIQIVTQHSSDYMAEFAERANKAAQALNTTTTKYTDASLIYYQQGLSDAEVEKRTAVTIKMANAAGEAAQTVSQELTSVWNNFYDGSKSLEYYADVMTKLGAETASSSAEIANGLQKFAAIGDTVGLSYEYAASALATITATTRESADTVGNALKTLFARIQGLKLGETLEDGVDLNKYSQALESVGISILEANGELKDMDNILDELMARWGQLSDAQQTALAQTVAGQRQYAQFMTLMNNADFFQENVDRAKNSEGSLQEQADIYAQSWEAARDRVKAAAEGIYQSLIDDKFFIGIDDLLAGILNSINGLIKGLGGIPGVLTTIGALLTKIFSAQMASNIDRIINNITGASVKGAQQLQKESIDALKKQAQTASLQGSQQGQAQAIGLKGQADLQQTLLDNQSRYNEEQIKTAQHILDQNESLRQQASEAGKLADIEKARAESQKQRILAKVNTAGEAKQANDINGYLYDSAETENRINKFQQLTEKGQELTDVFAVLKGVMHSDETDPLKISILQENFNKISPELDKFVNTVRSLNGNKFTGLESLLGNLKQSISNFDGTDSSIQKVEQSLDKFLSKIISLGFQGEGELKEFFQNCGMGADEAQKAVDELTQSFEQNGKISADLRAKIIALITGIEGGKKAMEGMKTASLTTGQILSNLASLTMSLASVIRTLSTFFDTLTDSEKTANEKFSAFLAMIPSLLMSLSMLTNSLTSVASQSILSGLANLTPSFLKVESAATAAAAGTATFSQALLLALPWVAGISLALLGLHAAFNVIETSTIDYKLRQAQKAAQEASNKFKDIEQESNNLQESFDKYESIRDELDQCTAGTEQWRSKLEEVNQQVLDIIEQFPELAQYMTMKDGALFLDENGVKEYQDYQKYSTIASFWGQQEAQQQVNDLNVEQLRNDLENDNWANTDLLVQSIREGDDEVLRETNSQLSGAMEKVVNSFEAATKSGEDWDWRKEVPSIVEETLKANNPEMAEDLAKSWAEENIDLNYFETKILKDLQSYVKTQNIAQTSEEQLNPQLGQYILSQNEDFMSKANSEDVLSAAGAVVEKILPNIRQMYQDENGQWDEEAIKSAYKLKYGPNSIYQTDEEGKITKNEKDIDTLVKTLMSEDLYEQLPTAIEGLRTSVELLAKSGDEQKQALADIMTGKGLISEQGGKLYQDFKKFEKEDNENPTTSSMTAPYRFLQEAFGVDADGLEEIAEAAGMTAQELVNAFTEGLINYSKDLDAAKKFGPEELQNVFDTRYKNDEANDNIQNVIDTGNKEQLFALQDLLNSIYATNGIEGVESLTEFFEENSEHFGEILNSIIESGNLQEFLNNLSEMGIELKSTNPILKLFFDGVSKFKDLGEDPSKLYAERKKIADSLSEKGDTITAEEYSKLESFAKDFFEIQSDGTYALIKDAELLKQTINEASFNDFKEKFQKSLLGVGEWTQENGTQALQLAPSMKQIYQDYKDDYENAKSFYGGRDSKEAFKYVQDQNKAKQYSSVGDILKDYNDKIDIENGSERALNVEDAKAKLQELIDTGQIANSTIKDIQKAAKAGLLTPEQISPAIQAVASTAKTFNELDKIIKEANDDSVDFTDSIIAVLNQPGGTTEEKIAHLRHELEQGNGEAKTLLKTMYELNSANDDTQTTSEKIAENDATNKANQKSDMSDADKAESNKQAGLSNIGLIASADDMFDTDKVSAFYTELKKVQEGEKLTAIEARQLGQAATQIFKDADFLGTEKQIQGIRDAFAAVDGEIERENLKAYADSIKDLILNSESMTLDKKLETVKTELIDAGVPISYLNKELGELILADQNLSLDEKLARIKEELGGNIPNELSQEIEKIVANDSITAEEGISKIKELCGDTYQLQEFSEWVDKILNNNGTNTFEKISQLLQLLKEGMSTDEMAGILSEQYSNQVENAEDLGRLIKNNNNNIIQARQETKNAAENTREANNNVKTVNSATTITDKDGKTSQDNSYEAIMARNKAQQELNKSQKEYTDAKKYEQGLEESISKSYQEYAQQLDGSKFDSIKDLESTWSLLAAQGANVTEGMKESDLVEYASQFDRCTDAVNNYYDALNRGEDVSDELLKLLSLASIEDAAKAYELDADQLQTLTQSYLEMAQSQEDYSNTIIGNIEGIENNIDVQRRATAAAMETAVRDMEVVEAKKTAAKETENYNKVLDILNDETEEGLKTNKQARILYEDLTDSEENLREGMAALLHVQKSMISDNMLKKYGKIAVDALNDVEGALEELQEKSEVEFLINLGVDEEQAQQTAEEAMSYLNELDPGESIDWSDETWQSAFDSIIQAAIQANTDINGVLDWDGMVEDANTAFDQIGVDGIDLSPLAQSIEEGAGQVEDATGHVVDATGIDVEATGDVAEETAESEFTGVDVEPGNEATITFAIPRVRAGEAPGGEGQIPVADGVEILHGHAEGYRMVPRPEPQEVTKREPLMGIQATGGNKTAGGNIQKPSGGGGGGGRRGGGCFIAGTPVTTINGYKNIENIQIGDIVLSYNEQKQKNEYSTVLDTMIHVIYDNIYILYINNEQLNVTGIHRFLIKRNNQQQWIQASELKVNDLVLFADGSWHIIEKINIKIELKAVYNFEVDCNHNYYVGYNQILAHNKGRGGRGGSGRAARATITRAVRVDHKDSTERYHYLDKSLESLNKQYDQVNKAKDLAFGGKHLTAINKEIELQDKLIKKQKDYRDAIEANLKKDRAALNGSSQDMASEAITRYTTTTTKGNELTEKEKKKLKKLQEKSKLTKKQKKQKKKLEKKAETREEQNFETKNMTLNSYLAGTDAKTINYAGRGIQAQLDEGGLGLVQNIAELKAAADARYNANADWYSKNYKEVKYDGTNLKQVQNMEKIANWWAEEQALYEQAMKNIEQYEETLRLYWDKVAEQIDAEITQIENRIEKAVYTVDVQIELDDSKLELIDFQLERMGDHGRNAAAQISKIGEALNINEDKVKQANTRIQNIFSTIAKDNLKSITDEAGTKWKFASGNSTFLGGQDLVTKLSSGDPEKTDEAIKELMAAYKEGQVTKKQIEEITSSAKDLLSYTQNTRTQYFEMFNTAKQGIDYWNEQMQRVIDKQEHLNGLVEHHRNVVDLIGRTQIAGSQKAGRELEKALDETSRSINNTRAKNYKTQFDSANTQLASTEAKMKEAEQNVRNAEAKGADKSKLYELQQTLAEYQALYDQQADIARNAQNNMNAAFEAALQTNLDSWTRAMDRAVEEFNNNLAGTAVSLDYLADALQRFTDTHSTNVAEYEKVHQLRMLDLQAQKAIDEATDPRIQRELLDIQNEISASTAKDVKMSQYELDYLKQKLELKQAEAAFEDAQQAKTQVSLTRDNEGNFGYVYTADEGDVADAEQNYQDKIYEMQKANAEYVQDLQSQIVTAQQDYITAMQQVAADNNLTEEQRHLKMEQIAADYDILRKNLLEQLEDALMVSHEVYGQYSERYAEVTGDLTALNLDYIGEFEKTQLSIETGYTNLAEYGKKWEDSNKDVIESLKQSISDYTTHNEASFDAIGQKYDDYTKTVQEDTTKSKESIEELSGALTTLATESNTAFTDITTKLGEVEQKWDGSMSSMINSTENLIQALAEAQQEMISFQDVAESGAEGGDGTGGPRITPPPPGGRNQIAGRGQRTKVIKRRTYKSQIRKLRASQVRNLRAYKNKVKQLKSQRKYTRASAARRARMDKTIQKEALKAAKKFLMRKFEKNSKLKSYTLKYDTGGYTGEWGNNSGRLAMLHQKELVLNKDDTQNILSAVNVIRDLAQKIDLNALASAGAFSSGISGINGVSNGTLEQEVHITAEFPNATDRNEITEAFNNIIGLAAQYANK